MTRVQRRLAPALARGRSAMTWHGMALGRDGMGWDDTRHRSLFTMPAGFSRGRERIDARAASRITGDEQLAAWQCNRPCLGFLDSHDSHLFATHRILLISVLIAIASSPHPGHRSASVRLRLGRSIDPDPLLVLRPAIACPLSSATGQLIIGHQHPH